MTNAEKTARNEEIIRRAKNNESYRKLAKEFGISRTRVRQIARRDDDIGPRSHRVPKPVREEIVEMYESTPSPVVEVARAFGVSAGTVRDVLTEFGVEIERGRRSKKYREKAARRRERIEELIEAGKSSVEIADVLGMSSSNVRRILSKDE